MARWPSSHLESVVRASSMLLDSAQHCGCRDIRKKAADDRRSGRSPSAEPLLSGHRHHLLTGAFVVHW